MSNNSLIIPKSSNDSAAWQLRVREGYAADLTIVNNTIVSAIESWPVSDRLKRLSLPLLQYSDADLAEYRFLLHHQDGRDDGVAVVSKDTSFSGHGETCCALLHGLYIHADSQKTGVGLVLQQAVINCVRESGGEGLLVKAQRVSRSYFQARGYVEYVSPELDYPHLYWKAI